MFSGAGACVRAVAQLELHRAVVVLPLANRRLGESKRGVEGADGAGHPRSENTMWRKLLYSGFETCFGPSTQGAGTKNTSQIQMLRHFDKKGLSQC